MTSSTYDASDIKHLTGVQAEQLLALTKSSMVLDVQRNGRTKPRPTKTFISRLGRCYQAKLSLRDIGSYLDVNHNVVRDLIRDYADEPIKVARCSGPVRAEVRRKISKVNHLLSDGYSAEDTARRLGVSPYAVVDAGRELGYELGHGKRSKKHIESLPNLFDYDLAEALYRTDLRGRDIRRLSEHVFHYLEDLIHNPYRQTRSYLWHLDHIFSVKSAMRTASDVRSLRLVVHPGNFQIITCRQNTLRDIYDPASRNLSLVLDRVRDFNLKHRLCLKSNFPITWDQHWKWL